MMKEWGAIVVHITIVRVGAVLEIKGGSLGYLVSCVPKPADGLCEALENYVSSPFIDQREIMDTGGGTSGFSDNSRAHGFRANVGCTTFGEPIHRSLSGMVLCSSVSFAMRFRCHSTVKVKRSGTDERQSDGDIDGSHVTL